MEQIQIKDFGPIKDIEIIIKDINIYTGTNSSGKSTVSKIICIFKGHALRNSPNYYRFIQLLADYNIDFEIGDRTFIRYQHDKFYFEVKGQSVLTNFTVQDNLDVYNPIFIPSERIFFSTNSQPIFGLISNNISLPKGITEFGVKFEQARGSIKKFQIEFLDLIYEYDGRNDYILFSNGVKVKFGQVSSGLQSVLPLILVLHYSIEREVGIRNIFLIEQPELNIYPSMQKELIEYVLGRINQSKDQIVITTHSPYILTSLDNLVQAQNAVNSNSSIKESVNDLVPSNYWIDFKRISCYYFNIGDCKSTLDDEIGSIGPSHIDEVSIKISDTFERLLALRYPS